MGGRSLDHPLPKFSCHPVIVLVRTAHPGNLGAAARAMLNFGFSELRLLDPQCDITEEARDRAKFAGSVLDHSTIHTSWDECMQDIGLVIGTSGKREGGPKTSFRHFLALTKASEKAMEHGGKVALVFGGEGVGLTTSELDRCDLLTTIPTWEGYPICNLSHAVALFLYEMCRTIDTCPAEKPLDGGTRRILERSILELSESLTLEGTKSRMTQQTLKRTILRGLPSDDEAQQLIGAFVEATTAMQKVSDDEEWQRGRRRRIESQD
ncbi:MAG: TrmH family RNA methyltransferase [Candidatus Poseidoniaceae archaeon]|nr:TrmH family RNA methyltransferase [Candidatus Poseidoniaceae archaeon]